MHTMFTESFQILLVMRLVKISVEILKWLTIEIQTKIYYLIQRFKTHINWTGCKNIIRMLCWFNKGIQFKNIYGNIVDVQKFLLNALFNEMKMKC